MTTRDDVLQELGLTSWQARGAAAAPAGEALAVPAGEKAVTPAGEKAVTPAGEKAVTPVGVRGGIAAPREARGGGPLPALPLDARAAEIAAMDWSQLKASVAGCVACPLHLSRNKTVFGVGDEAAEWLFVGEGPGADEDLKGEPFVGQAGKLLDNMLAAIGLRRGSNVYIANIVKCRPPGNRNPEPLEAAQCSPYLSRQIALLKPRLIVALGKVAAVNLLRREVSVSSLRGKLHEYQDIPLIVTYHPAYLLRSLPEKAKAWEDLRFALDTMRALQNKQAAAT